MNELIKVGERIEIYLKYKSIGINHLGRLTDTSGAQVSNIIKGKNFGLDKIYILLKVLPDLAPNWLLFGEGEMLRESNSVKNSELDIAKYENERLKKDVEHLNAQLTYQQLAIEAYRKSFELAANANEELKEVMMFYKTRQEK